MTTKIEDTGCTPGPEGGDHLWRDRRAGLIIAAIGAFAVIVGGRYGIGSLTRVGPGFFPTILGTTLLLLGVAIFLIAGRAGAVEETVSIHHGDDRPVDLRGWVAIVAGCLWFIVATPHLGLVPGTFGCVFISALGDRETTLLRAAVLSSVVSLLGAAIFGWALKVGLPFFGS